MSLRVALISTPWPLFNRPSLQLGNLKAFLQREFPKGKVEAHHLYLDIAESLGYEIYRSISQTSWLSESCFAGLLYPGRIPLLERFWKRHAKGLSLKQDFREICGNLQTESDRILAAISWSSYRLIGFSICFNQLTSSLYFIHKIKKVAPDSKIVIGGSACSGEMGSSLLKTFAGIDFVVTGEGEKPLLCLLRRLSARKPLFEPEPYPGLLTRQDGYATGFSQLSNLDDLPVPDFSDFFNRVAAMSPEKRFLPGLPLEMSRGCWWRKPSEALTERGCAFCNLNLQWQGYRAKSFTRILTEIRSLVATYKVLTLSFMDNLLPPAELRDLFLQIAALQKDFRFFAEIRATTGTKDLEAMAEAGMAEVQVGIEALSTRLLRKMNKGTTAIQNLQVMKHCEASDLPRLTSNLIIHFPGSDGEDVKETLENLRYALPFRPLKTTPFWLGYGSPIWSNPDAYGIRKIQNHPWYANIFPKEILGTLTLMIQAYQGGVMEQKRMWRPVSQAIQAWNKSYSALHRSRSSKDPILSYQDGKDFMIIRELRNDREALTHRLHGTSRGIYLFCEENREIKEILHRYPGFGEEKVLPFLTMMREKKLMFREGERYLSLAVPGKGYGSRRIR
ncbi:MAG: RiPP maturation radical SAM C-methyltransferase [Deltaproteobacteria bacterium]|nr:RiPP maturation radical SAM C-methyltransferase [Deltaproteobacteria bacterium]